MNDKIKNIFKITFFSGIILGTIAFSNTSYNEKKEIIPLGRETKVTSSLTLHVIQLIGWDKKTDITLADWATDIDQKFGFMVGSFEDNTTLVTLEIAKQIQWIFPSSIKTPSLTSVIFEPGSKLVQLDSYGISSPKLKSLVLPESLVVINDFALAGNSALTSIAIPKLVKELNANIFSGNIKLVDVTLSEGLTTINDNSLSDLPALKKIVIPSTVTSIGPNSFSNTPSLMDITMSSSFKGDDTPKYGFTQVQWDAIKWVYAPNLATIITADVLKSVGFNEKETITLADWATYLPNAKELANNAMNFSGTLTSLEIPAGIEVIGGSAIDTMPTLKVLTFAPNSKLHTIKARGITGTGITSLILPNSIVNLLEQALEGNGFLTSLTLPNKITTLSTKLLLNAQSLEQLIIPESVISIGDETFSGMGKLKKIIIPNTVNSIGTNTFSGTTSLNDITMNIKFKTQALSYGFTQIQWDAINWIYNLSNEAHITKNIITFVGFDKKEVITLEDWATYLPNAKTMSGSFYNNKILKYIQIPAQIEWMGDNVFNSTINLENIIFSPGSIIISIGEAAIANTKIISLTLPNTITSISKRAFSFNPYLVSLTLPNKIAILESNLLFGAISLEQLIIPESVTSIGATSFSGMEKLKKIIIPAAVNSIGINAFDSTTSLTDITMNYKFKTPDISYGFTQVQWDSIKWVYNATASKTLTEEIARSLGWDKKTGITYSDWETMAPNVTTINGAFLGNVFLESIEIPTTVIEVGVSAFQNTSKLALVTFQDNSKLTTINNLAFSNTKISTIAIPNLVTTINQGAFSLNKSLTTFVIPSTITVIAPNLLEGSSNVKEVIIPDSIITIGDNAFKDMTTIKKIIIPGSVQTIGANSFAGTTQLLDITMNYSFQGNNTLKYGFTQIQWDVIKWVHMATTAKILTLDVVKSIGWDKKTSITLSDWKTMAPNITSMDRSFIENNKLVSLEIPKTVLSIGTLSIQGTLLSTLTFEQDSKLTTIEEYGITLTNIKNLVLPKSVKTIGDFGLSDNSKLISVVLPDELKTLNANLFSGSVNIKEIQTPSTLTTIMENAFAGLITLKKISLPETVVSISKNSFLNTTSLTDITMYYNLKTKTPSYGFIESQWEVIKWLGIPDIGLTLTKEAAELLGWDKKTSITLSDWKKTAPNVTSISSAFLDNKILVSIEIPNYIIGIEKDSFKNTTILESVEFESKSKLEVIGDQAFSNSVLKSIKIPNSTLSIGANAFQNTMFLSYIEMPRTFEISIDHFGLTDEQWNNINWTPFILNVVFITVISLLGVGLITQILFSSYIINQIKKQTF